MVEQPSRPIGSIESVRLAVLRPDADFLRLLESDRTAERSYSQPCRDWPSVKPHLAILLTPHDHVAQARVWGLGIVRPAHKTDRDRKVFVAHARRFKERVKAAQVWQGLRSFDGSTVAEAGPVAVQAEEMIEALRQVSLEVVAQIVELMQFLEEGEGWSGQDIRWRDERDALLLFMKIAGVDPKNFAAVRSWQRSLAGPSYLAGVAGDSVQPTLDSSHGEVAARFRGSGKVAVRLFKGQRDRRSYEFEATTITAEGVERGEPGSLDAYYYHALTGSMVIVRYLSIGPDSLLLPGPRRPLEGLRAPSGVRKSGEGSAIREFRLLDDPVFLRVHPSEPFTAALHRTSSGAIYPYGQVAGAIEGAVEAGLPGFHAEGLERHLVPTDFTRLVRDGWLGSRGVSLDVVVNEAARTLETVGAALVVSDFSSRPRGNGSGLSSTHP